LGFDGTAEQVMESFSTAGASQVAVSYPSLGDVVSNKLSQEQTKEAANPPVLVAHTRGVKEFPQIEKGKAAEKETAKATDGVTGKEPSKQELERHRDHADPPFNERINQTLEKPEEGGFLSWFKSKFKAFLSGITTSDPGLNIRAGERPIIDTSGKANPERSDKQRKDGEDQVQAQKKQTVDQFRANPGQQQIQPVEVNETKQVRFSKEDLLSVETGRQDDMVEYFLMPLPTGHWDCAQCAITIAAHSWESLCSADDPISGEF
jgi:hypothetical protein